MYQTWAAELLYDHDVVKNRMEALNRRRATTKSLTTRNQHGGKIMTGIRCVLYGALVMIGVLASAAAHAQGKPNILVIWGDDVGQSNISAYTFGLVGERNSHRLADTVAP